MQRVDSQSMRQEKPFPLQCVSCPGHSPYLMVWHCNQKILKLWGPKTALKPIGVKSRIDSIAVSLFVDWWSLSNPNNNLMTMRRAGLSRKYLWFVNNQQLRSIFSFHESFDSAKPSDFLSMFPVTVWRLHKIARSDHARPDWMSPSRNTFRLLINL